MPMASRLKAASPDASIDVGRLQAATARTILAPLSPADGMIAFLRGRILEKQPNRVIVDVQGVGYEVVIPLSTYYDVGDEGSEVALRVHTHVREDALQLYGFITDFERQVFERLIGSAASARSSRSRCCPASTRAIS
jgi:hypothetical protein